jgi:hypothetical protein
MPDKEEKVEEKIPEFKFENKMIAEPIVAPDGHEVLSAEDIKERDKNA